MAVAIEQIRAHDFPMPSDYSSVSVKPKKHDSEGEIDYLVPNEDGTPVTMDYHDLGSFIVPNTSIKVKIHDVTGDEDKFSLDVQGFQFLKHTSKETNFQDYNNLTGYYFKETEQLIKDVTGASRVVIYNHQLRNSFFDFNPDTFSESNERPPCQRIHADHSHKSGEMLIQQFLPDEAEEILAGRARVINVWRPITTIERDPLVLADSRSIPPEDLVAVPVEAPRLNGQICYLTYRQGHQWYYKHHLTKDEVIMFKSFDTLQDGRAERAAHASCDIGAGPNVPPRRSVEIRAIVIG